MRLIRSRGLIGSSLSANQDAAFSHIGEIPIEGFPYISHAHPMNRRLTYHKYI